MSMSIPPVRTGLPLLAACALVAGCSPEPNKQATLLGEDTDGDGYATPQDCDDSDAEVHPAADEVYYDGLDNDCDPSTADDDQDGDGTPVDDDCDDTVVGLTSGTASFQPLEGADVDLSDAFSGEVVIDSAGALLICGGTHAVHLRIEASDVTVRGIGSSPTVLDGTQSGRVLQAEGAQRLTVEHVTFTQGFAESGGAAHLVGSDATFRDVAFMDNTADSDADASGGALYGESSTVRLENVHFEGNLAKSGNNLTAVGGAVALNECAIHVDTVQFVDNSVLVPGGSGYRRGGALYLSQGRVAGGGMKDVTFSANISGRTTGGAMYADLDDLELTDAIFDRNEGSSGGGLYVTGSLTLSRVDFTHNVSSGSGGGLNVGGYLTATNTTFTDNTAENSGGGATVGEDTELSRVTFSGNSAGDDGGGLRVEGSSSTGSTSRFDAVDFAGNTAGETGGGLALRFRFASFTNGSFTDNTATIAGGGMFLDGRYNNNNVDVSAMDWTGNRASSGGAIWADIDNYGYIRGSGVHFDDNLVGDVTVGYSVGGTDYTTHTISGSTISCNRYGC